MKRSVRGTRIGIAIGAAHATAEVRRGAAVQRVTLDVDGDAVDAVRGLRSRVDAALGADTAGARVAIALLPPFAESRLLALPPLRSDETDAVVRRDAGRHFVSVRAPRVTAAVRPRRDAPVLAGAADARLLESLREAVEAAGWQLDVLTTAHSAWTAAAAAESPSRRPTTVVAAVDGTAHVLAFEDDGLAALRRAPVTAAADVAGAARGPQVTLLAGGAAGPDAATDSLADRLREDGLAVHLADASAELLAARHAADAALRLVPATVLAERRERQRLLALRLAAAAVLMLVATAAVEYWGAARELDAVAEQRAALRAEVAPLLAMRDSIDRLNTSAADIDAVARTAPRWTAALFDLAVLLPAESHVTRLFATGDTIVIDAQGERAGAALQALRASSVLQDARLVGIVDRELADGATSMERFRIRARLDAASAAADAPRTAAAAAAPGEDGS